VGLGIRDGQQQLAVGRMAWKRAEGQGGQEAKEQE
jgi:hypothetical protein